MVRELDYLDGVCNKLEAHPPHWKDAGCKYWPTCQGNDKYPVCVFRECMEDLTDSEGEEYSKKDVIIVNRWFFKEIGR